MDFAEDLWTVTFSPNEGQLLPEQTFMGMIFRESALAVIRFINFVSRMGWFLSLGKLIYALPFPGPREDGSPGLPSVALHFFIFMASIIQPMPPVKRIDNLSPVYRIFSVSPLKHHTENPTPRIFFGIYFAIIIESTYRRCHGQNRRKRKANIVPSQPGMKPAMKSDEIAGCSWPCLWYILLLGSYCISSADAILKSNYFRYDYVGPMRITEMPSFYFRKYTYDRENLLDIFPCLEAQASPHLSGHFEQPSVGATLNIGWGSPWACRSKENPNQWYTSSLDWNSCTTFVCREDGLSTCPCYPDRQSARNASKQCMDRAFNMTLLDLNATFVRHQPPWKDTRNWPTLTRYGKCVSYYNTESTQHIRQTTINALLYQQFGVVLLSFGSSMILLKIIKNEKCVPMPVGFLRDRSCSDS